MKTGDKAGLAGLVLSVGIAIIVLLNTSNGRAIQEGFILQLVAAAMFLYEGARGSRWWFISRS